MLVAGAKRHAKEILEILHQLNKLDGLHFFDDISEDVGDLLFAKFPVIRTLDTVKKHFVKHPEFILAIGNPKLRKVLADKLTLHGGKMISLISKTVYIGHYNVELGNGLNLMHNVMISNDVKVGTGCLINAYVSIHHDVSIGDYCEVSPHSTLLGGCSIGEFTSIGSSCTILPNVKIGNNVILGAGAVVTKDIPDNVVAYGVPARFY